MKKTIFPKAQLIILSLVVLFFSTGLKLSNAQTNYGNYSIPAIEGWNYNNVSSEGAFHVFEYPAKEITVKIKKNQSCAKLNRILINTSFKQFKA